MPDVWLPYGKTDVCVRVPSENFKDEIKTGEVKGAENPRDEIERSIKNPIDVRGLSEIVKSGDKVALALNIFDPSISNLIVSIILSELTQAGLKSGDLTVIFAQDPFNLQTGRMKEQIKNELSPLGVNVAFHDGLSECVYIGDTSSGIKTYINKVFFDSKVKIVASSIEPNPYTLYNGDGYAVVPGLSNMDTVSQILMPILNIDDPLDYLGGDILSGISEASHLVKVDFSVNIVRNLRGEVVKSFAGEMEKAYSEAARSADALYKVQVERKVDAVFASPGGSPYDANLFEACKCLENSLRAVRRNGILVLVAECFDGYGDPDFYEATSKFREDPLSLEKSLRKRFSIGGFMAYRFLKASRKFDICMVSAIPDYYVSEKLGLKVFRAANEALNYALEKSGRKSKISVIPRGNLTIPVIAGSNATNEKK
ncbi:MAG: lactate racemase domain-containing protein [Candidatus Bathyarchaeia archaeon]